MVFVRGEIELLPVSKEDGRIAAEGALLYLLSDWGATRLGC
ncbi:hypothetical protein [Sodalis-like endosymbiont of Proechinophthirus fluctus]|nr:hypothetical protein [Sodalis-like endosymbiont of Proechinophthirus fluctus]